MPAMIRDLLDRVLSGAGPGRLRWWICFSGALHLAMIVTLLAVPASTARRDLPVPVYTVDLVPGPPPAPKAQPVKPAPREPRPAPVETLPLPEEDDLDEVVAEPVVPEPPKTVKAPKETPPPPKEKQQVKKPPEPKVKEAPPKKRKKKAVKPKKKPVKPKKVVKRKKPVKPKKVAVKKKAPKKRPAKVAGKTSTKPKRKASQVVERVRQARIEDAVAIARERAKLRQKIGLGQGAGAAARGAGTGSGGLLKAREFVVYLNGMREIFKERWTWIGKRRDLEATVSFGVRADGEIFGLKLLESSGDAGYDESVVRAVRRSVLPPPPRRYAREFAEVEFTFRPDPEG